MHNLKAENSVLSSRLTENLSLGCSLSDSSEGLFQRVKKGARIYRSFCKQNKTGSQTSKDYCQLKKNQTSKVDEFSASLCGGRYKSIISGWAS